jgi:hypothetical protein
MRRTRPKPGPKHWARCIPAGRERHHPNDMLSQIYEPTETKWTWSGPKKGEVPDRDVMRSHKWKVEGTGDKFYLLKKVAFPSREGFGCVGQLSLELGEELTEKGVECCGRCHMGHGGWFEVDRVAHIIGSPGGSG